MFNPTIDWSLLLLCSLLLSSMHDHADTISLSKKQRILCFSTFLLSVFAPMLMMLFMYTPFGSEVIEGVQGRYFLPALPMLGLALGASSISLAEKAKKMSYAKRFYNQCRSFNRSVLMDTNIPIISLGCLTKKR